jgi:hypothetical protein
MKDIDKSSQLFYYKKKSKELERKLNIYRLALEVYSNPIHTYDQGYLARLALTGVLNKTFEPKRLDGCTFDVRYVEFNLNGEYND